MYWVLQDNMFREDGFHALNKALERLELPYSVHKVVPFVGTLIPDVNPDGKVVVLGSFSLDKEARRKGWVPGSFATPELNYRTEIEQWGTGVMLNEDSCFCAFGEVPFQPRPFFIRPVDDGKSLVGQVIDWGDYTEWRERLVALEDTGSTLTLDTPVMVSATKKIWTETRVWIVEGEVVTASEYKRGTRVQYRADVDARILHYAGKLARKWSPAPAFVMDVADTPQGLRILEAGCINSAGFYAADMQRLVIAMEEAYG